MELIGQYIARHGRISDPYAFQKITNIINKIRSKYLGMPYCMNMLLSLADDLEYEMRKHDLNQYYYILLSEDVNSMSFVAEVNEIDPYNPPEKPVLFTYPVLFAY